MRRERALVRKKTMHRVKVKEAFIRGKQGTSRQKGHS